ncbi:AGR2 protein, partial [Polyodon spathula]|nr:AGR2 protein [Polyodon spathula]
MVKGLMSVLLILVAVSSSFGNPEKNGSAKKEKKSPQTLSRESGVVSVYSIPQQTVLVSYRYNNKPVMVIHHLEDCPHSQALKQVFSSSKKIQKMADEDFIVLNLVYETTDKHLSPDGQYVPRIIFVDPSLTVRADITGRYANRLYTYEPADINLCKYN